ncbi:MAG: Uma2 family endonuclease [Coleofasciculaceae cyanobacterium RL_1_1]|nr:Uma2 family endonuclease [Coleofasciculaceae cyanobacterium RL_1_1]
MLANENLTLHPPANHELSDDWFFDFCAANRDLHIERTAHGEILIMAPTGGETGYRNSKLSFQLELWNRRTKLGVTFDSSTGFRLPNGANRSPDAAWIPNEWWERLSGEERQRFLPLSPLFAIELRSATDTPSTLRAKMQEYIDNGTELGWLIDPFERTVEVYRPEAEVTVWQGVQTISADPILPDFELELDDIL